MLFYVLELFIILYYYAARVCVCVVSHYNKIERMKL